MLITGTVARSASSSISWSSPVRIPIAAAWRESTYAVSRTDSPRESWRSSVRSTIGWPPSSVIPVSNDTRVRVDGFWKISATVRLRSASELNGLALSTSARSISAFSSSRLSSDPVMKWRGKRRVYVAPVVLRVLTWNLFHGRAVPPARRDLFGEFPTALSSWQWDVALLQEVPPWWPSELAAGLGAEQRLVLTSRNALLPIRRAIAVRRPDLIKSNGGGADAILVRSDAIAEHRWRRLCIWPERRWVHAVRLTDAGVWVANTHCGGPIRDARRAAESALRWAGTVPVVLGGDFNIREPALDGFAYAGGHGVDEFYVRGLSVSSGAETLDRGHLSDHVPVVVTVGY